MEFNFLRNTYKKFIYHNYKLKEDDEKIILVFHFEIENLKEFYPKIEILKKDFIFKDINSNIVKNIVFNMLDEAGKNMSNYQIVGGNQIKIYIEEGKQNKDLAEEIKSKLSVEEVATMAFNIRIKYDSKAKVNEIIIELVQPVQGQ